MFWRPTSVFRDLLPRLADVFRHMPEGLASAA
jgi:hypothetical protein